jgi:predicted transcriptional regulator
MCRPSHAGVAVTAESPDPPGASVSELYMLLSSTDRRRIVSELQYSSLHLNEIAKKFDLAATEALRQVHRLTEARLLERVPDGSYRATALSKLVLDTVAPMDFIVRFREFVLEHDVSALPPEFRARLSDLSECTLVSSEVKTFESVTQSLADAKKRIDATIELGFGPAIEIMRNQVNQGLRVRWLIQENFLPSALRLLRGSEKKPEIRYVPHLTWHVYLTESRASVAFRDLAGRMSYVIFTGESPNFLRWAGDLFTHGWNEAMEWSSRLKG